MADEPPASDPAAASEPTEEEELPTEEDDEDEEEAEEEDDDEAEDEEEEGDEEENSLLERAQAVISRVVAQEADPNPRLIHTLATISENDDFYELVFCKFLSDTSYSEAIRCASARLLLSIHNAWASQFPHAFEDATIANLKKWIREDAEACDWKHFGSGEKSTDTEMLRTYAVGLLSMALYSSGGQLVEDILNIGVSAKLMHFLRTRVNGDVTSSQKISPDQDLEDFVLPDHEQLLQLREKYSILCLQVLGEYVEALGPVLHEKGVDVCLALLQRGIKDQEGCGHVSLLHEILRLICALAAHRKFAALFVDRGGIQKILAVPRITQTYTALSTCLFTFGSLQSTMERVCALSSDTLNNVVELALQLLECPQDSARKNAAIFFAAAFVFKAVLDSFDAQDGMQKLLNILHVAASVRSGVNSGALGSSNANQGNDRSPAEVLTATEKQVAYHSCVALRQYFRAHLLQLVDSIRPSKSIRSIARNTSSARAGYKPFDIGNEAMDAIFRQIQRDRKLGPALVRTRWPVMDKFLASNGHITMLELCQGLPSDRYLHDLAQYAFGVLHIITLMPHSRKLIVHGTLSNNRIGMTILLDIANSVVGYVDPEVICPALNVLVNLVCPPPSFSIKPSSTANQQPGSYSESRDRTAEKLTSERNLAANQGESGTPVVPSGVVGDKRISLGVGAGGPGLAAQLEQGYRQAREVVRANNGIKILLQLLSTRMVTPPVAIDAVRALACRVLLGLARDDAIAHILTELQVGKKLSELIRDTSTQTSGSDNARWINELTQVAIELIAVLTNSGNETTLAATDAAAPALKRIERAGIAAATPISYHSRELMQLIHEHLLGSGLAATAAMLQKEADLAPSQSTAPVLPVLWAAAPEPSSVQVQQQWPSGRVQGFLPDKTMIPEDQAGQRSDSVVPSSKKKALVFSPSFSKRAKPFLSTSGNKACNSLRSPVPAGNMDTANTGDAETSHKTPMPLPLERKLADTDLSSASAAKCPAIVDQSCQFKTPAPTRRGLSVAVDSPTAAFHQGRTNFNNISTENFEDSQGTPGVVTGTPHLCANDQQSGNLERMTLDSLVVQYLKHQHRQCPSPITTLPPVSLLQPHVCPEPSRSISAPPNVTARMGSREISREISGIQVPRRDRQFIYSRFKPCRVCHDESSLLTCMTFIQDASRVAAGNHTGELRIFDSNTANLIESQSCHQHLVTTLESTSSGGGNELILSSSLNAVKLWDSFSVSTGPLHTFEDCKAARFNHAGTLFAAISTDAAHRAVLLYDVQTRNVEMQLPDNSSLSGSGRNYVHPIIHFSPSDDMLLWNGVLWDRRSPTPIHQFDQFTDYCGGGFHPAGNEVILNSEVWDLRKFKLLRSVPSLDQTVIKFNGRGDVIYAILRRNLEDVTSSINTRRVRHPLFPAFRTIDAVTYSDIATVQIDRGVLDLTTEPNNSLLGVIAMDDPDEMFSSARLFEVGWKRPTDDDADPEDGGDSEDEDEDSHFAVYHGHSPWSFTYLIAKHVRFLQSTMERVCALSSDTLNNVVELALQLLECPQDSARKNAAIFFAAAFVFKGVLDSFDAQDGMQKLLNILHVAASVRSGVNSGALGSSNANQGNDRSPAEVLTTTEKQVAYHSCVALRQYFRAHLLQLVDSIRPSKSIRSIARNTSSARAGYKPFDIGNEAMDAIFRQIQRDRKLGPALVRTRWPVMDKFLASNGHITMLELCQGLPSDRYLHDLAQYAFGVLHIITLMPHSRKLIVHGTLSNNRIGMTILLDIANSVVGYVDPEVICPALNVLVNLVCPPPSFSIKPSSTANQQPGSYSESKDRTAEKLTSERNLAANQGESGTPVVPSGVVGDKRISLGVGAGGPGLAAQLEQGYRQAREVVRANNGIKILLQLLSTRMVTPPVAIDAIRALACRVLLGLARDDAIAHILTELQVGKKLSELIRDTSTQTSGSDNARWINELTQVAIELIAVLTNSGKETTLAATDAAAPALKRIERAGIATATPISYHSRELMQLIHEHLLGSGLAATAAMLQKEADLAPSQSTAPVLPVQRAAAPEPSSVQVQQQWPSGRVQGFLPDKTMIPEDQAGQRSDSVVPLSKKKALVFSPSFSKRAQPFLSTSGNKACNSLRSPVPAGNMDTANTGDAETSHKTPMPLPLERKLADTDLSSASAAKRPAIVDQSCQFKTPAPTRRGLSVAVDSPTAAFHQGRTNFNNISTENFEDSQGTPGVVTGTPHLCANDQQSGNLERMTLDSLVVQYLKHQHRQCPAPITTLPPVSLLQPHVCPEPSRSISAPPNVTACMGSREISREISGIQVPRRDRQFIYSRFKPCRVCRDESSLLTCMTFIQDASRVAAGNHTGELRIFDSNTANLIKSQSCHQHLVTTLESTSSGGGNELILSSSLNEVKLWDSFSVSTGPLHTFEDCKAARFNHAGTLFAAISTDAAHRAVLLYDVQTRNVEMQLPDNSSLSGSGRNYVHPIIHFSPSDDMLLWNGVLWDRRSPTPIHQFDQFTDYCGGGFHPAGNEVILNSEVWDLRKFKLLRSVPSLDQTVIKFNGRGDVIYAILRRNLEDVTSSINTRRVRHPLFPAFRTIDAVTYSDIATVQIDRGVLDLTTEPNNSLLGVIAMDDPDEMFSSARLFEVGWKRPTDDDADPEDGGDSEDEDEDSHFAVYHGHSPWSFTYLIAKHVRFLQSTMERVCALSSDTPNNVVELALQLLECPQDSARKNAAIFFAAAFVFKGVLDSFDAQDGMQKLLNILHVAASVRSGVNSGALGSSNANQGNDRSPAEVLTTTEKQVAYHSCVALRQYFRAHLLQLVDSIRPSKSIRSIARNTSSARAGYKPFDIGNEAMDAIFRQIQRDRKLGPALVRTRWPVMDKFLASNGHITMLELCQGLPSDRYLHDLAQYAFGVLHIITLMPHSRKLIVHGTLSNNRIGMTILLDIANSVVGYVDPEVICPALNVLVNLVCPPPSFSIKPSSTANQQPGSYSESKDRTAEKLTSERNLAANQGESGTPVVPSGVVGDKRISLGVGAGGPGLAAQLEQGYRQAREVVRANNGIKILLQLLSTRMVTPPVAIDAIRALACRVLLGLARDDAIAHILTELQVGKKLSELIRDTSTQTSGSDNARWINELTQVAIELIAVLTNSGKETTLAATDAAAPALKRIERAGIATATPISYHSRELMQLIHEHLLGSGLAATAAMLQKEADLAPSQSTAPVLPVQRAAAPEPSSVQVQQQWPSGRVQGFLPDKTMIPEDQAGQRSDSVVPLSKKKALVFSPSFSKRAQPFLSTSGNKACNSLRSPVPAGNMDTANTGDAETSHKTPMPLPLERKLADTDLSSASAAKRPAIVDQSCQFKTPAPTRRGLSVAVDSPTAAFHQGRTNFNNISTENFEDSQGTPGVVTGTPHLCANDQQSGNLERMTLDSLVVQYLKHQHRQCPAPITTLPPVSLLQPHVCPEPSRSISAPPNVTACMGSREISREISGIQVPRRDRQFIYSRFKPCRVCRDESSLLTCMTFIQDASRVAAGNHTGELRIFDSNTANLIKSQSCHQHLVTTLESTSSGGGNELILSSSLNEVKLWDSFSVSTGPLHTFEDCKAARFNHAGTLFAAISTDAAHRAVLLYDVQTRNVEMQLPDNSSLSGSGRNYVHPIIHFSPSDDMLLWNGVLWDRRSPTPIHQFDQFTDYCGGGFHPAGNEVILNSEVWDLRKFKHLRSVPSLDQTVIKFNGRGDVIYAILRRNLEDVTSSINTRRVRHPLFPTFRTIDAVTYSDIATVQIDRGVLDLTTEPNDSLLGVVAMDDPAEMFSSARLFDVGRKRPTDDDSDLEDGGDSEDEERVKGTNLARM